MAHLNLLLCAATCLAIFVGTSGQNRNLVITSHESLSAVYVDEVQQPLPNANEKNATDDVLVPVESRLIAVQAVSTVDVCAGFIGSVTDDYLLTDGSWKCSEFGAENWFELGFDDSSWPNAVVVGRNGNVPSCPGLTERIPDISLLANWIWTEMPVGSTTAAPRSGVEPLVDRAVFCRGYLPFCQTYWPCVNGGTCLNNSHDVCACPPEWAGRYCEKVWTPCANEPCANNGTCIITGDTTYRCSCNFGYTGRNCETMYQNRNLSITAKSTVYDLYVDGMRQNNLSHANNWTIADTVSISPISRLIGVMAIDSTETCAGILGSVSDDYLVTDDINWKCSYIPDPQWFRLGWDDVEWPAAYIIDENSTLGDNCDILTDVPPISPAASWIWTDTIQDPPLYHQTIYCRGYLPLCQRDSPCYNGGSCNMNNVTLCSCLVGFIGDYCEAVDLKNVSITAKDNLYAAYVDGRPINLENGAEWQKTDTFQVNTTSRLIALMAVQLHNNSCPGILASVSDSVGSYVLSNASWKCSPSAPVGWSDLGFNDTLWPAARIMHINEDTNDTLCQNDFTEIASISSDAYWIWTNNPSGQDVVAFCRGYLPICSVSPCKNGGICYPNHELMCGCAVGFTGLYCENQVASNTTTVLSGDVSNSEGAKPIPPPFVVPPIASDH